MNLEDSENQNETLKEISMFSVAYFKQTFVTSFIYGFLYGTGIFKMLRSMVSICFIECTYFQRFEVIQKMILYRYYFSIKLNFIFYIIL